MLNQKELKQLATGDAVNHYLVVNKLEIKTTRTNKEYLSLELRDASMNLPAKVWDNFDGIKKELKEGGIVKVSGLMEEFSGAPQIKINSINIAPPGDSVSSDDFMPKSKRDIAVMANELYERIDKIKNGKLKQLLKKILSGDDLEKYKRAPAGKAWHHAYIHGLLEHTLEIIRICDLMCDIHHEVKRDLLIAGAVLHDFGKVEELTFDNNFDYTDKGRLLGHIVIAASLIEKKAAEMEGFPEDLKNELIHLVLSHQGKLEFASPVVPKTLEAIILYHADELSAKTNAYKLAIEQDKTGGGNWTRFLPLAGTALYMPPEEEDEEKSLFD